MMFRRRHRPWNSLPADRWAVVAAPFVLALAAPLAAETVLHVPADVATIQAAIDTVPNGGTIEIAAGTYVPPTSTGFLIQNEGRGFTMRAAPAATVILDGQGTRQILRFQNTSVAAGRPVIFEGLTFANGFSATNARGGGLTIQFAQATFRDCIFRSNVATPANTGGGAVLAYDQVTLFFDNCLFEDNVAKNEGGALKIDGTNASPAVAFVHNCRFFDNLANPPGHRNTAAGGGIHVGNAKLWVTNSRFVGNQAGYVGGAIFGIGTWQEPVATPHAEVYIANSTFVGNQAVANGVAPPDAPEAGAVHIEDQGTMKIWNSRFDENSAGLAGAANAYRAILEIRDSVFRGNRATATTSGSGFGGAVTVISNDTGVDGANNRRSATLLVSGSLLQGRYGATTTAAQVGGCLYAAGDVVRRSGAVLPQGAATQTRAQVTISDVVFDDCDVSSLSAIPNGGAFELFHVNATISDTLVLRSDALGTGSGGGGGRIISESLATLTNVTFAKNSAVQYGGALYLAGADVDITGGAFLANEISPGVPETVNQSYGAALFVTGLDDFPTAGVPQNAAGNVSGVLFAENVGLPILDIDQDIAGKSYNAVTYNGNTFHSTSFTDGAGGFLVYWDTFSGGQLNSSGLNALFINRTHVPDTDKSTVANSFSAAAPISLALRAVPPAKIAVTASGDPLTDTESFAGYAWSGGSATFDGSPVGGNAGRTAVGIGNHTLQVSTQSANDAVATGPVPSATLVASPGAIAGGGSSNLTFSTVAGSELVGALDQGLPAPTTADGVQSVSPVASTTYMFLGITQQGAGKATATVLVDETPPFFADGFDLGDTSAWIEGP